MSEWKEIDFAKVLEDESISYGIVQPGPHVEIDSIPIVRVQNIKNGKIIPNDIKKVHKDIESSYLRTRLKGGELLITVVGSVGECAIVTNNFIGWNVARAVSVARIKDTYDKKFIRYCFATEDLKFQMYGNTNDTVQPTLNLKELKTLKLLIPPLPEQKAIAEVLSSLDDKIDLLHRQNKTLEQMAETLFRQWFVEDAGEDWEERKLGDFITPQKGKNITKSQAVDGVYPVIAGGLSPSCYHNKCNTKAPVITVSASGANAGFVNIHYTPVWSSDSSYIDSTITPYVYFYYIFFRLNQNLITDKQEGSAQPHIYPSHLMDLDILDYPEKLIEKFENICAGTFNKIKNNQLQIRTLEKLRDTLLPKLMSGEVRVKYGGI